ncbi:glycosyltransferase family 32 protein [Pseudohyphozyma bogoriensis]|nr:glycosyltransferase family 32 protein [Pseudohyphozyma bogoriensis]
MLPSHSASPSLSSPSRPFYSSKSRSSSPKGRSNAKFRLFSLATLSIYRKELQRKYPVLRRPPPPRRTLLVLLCFILTLYYFLKPKSSLVLSKEQVERVWRWELAAGRYPSRRSIVETFRGGKRAAGMYNPAAPPSYGDRGRSFAGAGAGRKYLPLPEYQDVARSPYPPRPVAGSAIDLDVVMDHCDFGTGKYVRDCLEDISSILSSASKTFSTLLSIRHRFTVSPSPLPPHPTHPTADPSCDPSNPRIFHMFWAGPFTDKPYIAVLSFLYTQRLSLHLPLGSRPEHGVCRPQMWIWINPGAASSEVDSRAERKMMRELEGNQWSRPLLDERFRESVKFRLWNTSEQLDGVKEMEGWRNMELFNSHGKHYKSKKAKPTPPSPPRPPVIKERKPDDSSTDEDIAARPPLEVSDDELSRFVDSVDSPPDASSPDPSEPKTSTHLSDPLFDRVGSSSKKDYDRLSTVLSDIARFVLCHRFGGIYIDADTVFLRDWEELWGWTGAFAYRWSRLKLYNTAVLKMARGSALGSTIFKTAIANGNDFHPMTVSRYMKEARMEELLLRLPDALFDSAWLNVEDYQIDRPAFPKFHVFEDFFEPPKAIAASPQSLGFKGFFRGAFSYHFHNFWWLKFDPARDFPDLGPRFETEQTRLSAAASVNQEEGDLSWSAVIKRTVEKYVRGEAPNAYGEWLNFETVRIDFER